MSVATLTNGGGFVHDREFAIFDETGYVNGKREPKVHALRVHYNDPLTNAYFTSELTGEQFSFGLADDPRSLEAWFAQHFGRRVSVRRQCHGGFPDDTTAPGPTLISSATLHAVASWFPELDIESVRSRLRTNIEVGDVPPFWEDQLYTTAGSTVAFDIGEALLEGTNPCQRCVVPSRDPASGLPIAGFAKRVAERRAATLPSWADWSRFDHFYRLAVNTRPAPRQADRSIYIGDKLNPIGTL